MLVRPYQPADFPAILDLINAASAADKTRHLPEHVLRSMLSPEPTDHPIYNVVSAAPNGQTTGFLWWDYSGLEFLRFEGWVHPGHRRKGYGTALLTAIEASARKNRAPGLPIRMAGRTYEDIEGAAALFHLRNFELGRKFFVMKTDLINQDFEHIKAPDHVVFRSFQRDDLESLVEADNAIFSDHWGSRARPVDVWKYEMIDTRPHDPGLWIVAWSGNEIVAECLCHASREGGPNDGWVSTVGVRYEWRGRGLGRAVLARGLRALQKVGYATATLTVDSENSSAVNLYRSLEMDVVRTRLHFTKTVG